MIRVPDNGFGAAGTASIIKLIPSMNIHLSVRMIIYPKLDNNWLA